MNAVRIIDNEILLGEICSLLKQGKRIKMRAKGNSMSSFIRGGEDILVLAPPYNLQRGDVVLARIDEKRYVVHRITKVTAGRITLMGDGNLYEKEECLRKDVFGIVECIIRAGKEHDLRSPTSRIRAMIWHCLLPFRRIKVNIIKRSIFR